MAVSLMKVIVLAIIVASFPLLVAQTIAIKVVNGRNGHPMVNSHVNVWVGNKQKDATAIPTELQTTMKVMFVLQGDGTITSSPQAGTPAAPSIPPLDQLLKSNNLCHETLALVVFLSSASLDF